MCLLGWLLAVHYAVLHPYKLTGTGLGKCASVSISWCWVWRMVMSGAALPKPSSETEVKMAEEVVIPVFKN